MLLSLCHCWSISINAQAGIQYWNTEDGLSNNTISQVLQDRNGYIWIATQYGLNRFDGYAFEQLRYRPNDREGLSANWVRSISQDSSGKIWLAADYGGIHLVDPLTVKATPYPLVGNDGREVTNVFSIYCAGDQSVWVGTSEKLFRKRSNEEQFEEVEIFLEETQSVLGNLAFLQIQEDKNSNIYLLTNTDIYQFEAASEAFTSIFSAPNRILKSIYTDREGTLWGVTNQQLIRFKTNNQTWTSEVFHEDDFNFNEFFFDIPIYEDHQNQLWIAVHDGVLVVDKSNRVKKIISKKELFPTETEHANILCFFEDKHQNIWMGSSNGLLLQSPLGQRFRAQRQIPHLEKFNEVRAVEQIGDSLFISNSAGLFVIDLRHGDQAPKKISNEVIFDFVASTNYLYAVGYRFHQIRRSNLDMETFDLEARAWSLTEDRNGHIWIASGINGLQRFNPQTRAFSSYDAKDILTLLDNSVINLLLDAKDRLWVASLLSGVYVLENASDLKDSEVPSFLNFNYNENIPTSLSNSLATGIAEDLNGDIWVGTDGGLNRISGKDYSIKRYLQEDGLEDEKIMGLLIDQNGDVWGSTIGHGIFRLDLQTEQFTFLIVMTV